MKRTALSLIALMLIVAILAGCSGEIGRNDRSRGQSYTPDDQSNGTGKPADTPDDKPSDPGTVSGADSGWIKFDVPDGYNYVKQSDQYLTITNQNDNNQFVRIARDYLMDRSLDQLVAEQISNDPGKYSKGADATFSGLSWQTINYTENGRENRIR